MTTKSVRKVVIVGGGVAAWMSAASLVRAFAGQPLSIQVIEDSQARPESLDFSSEESALPALRAAHRLLGIDEAEFMRATNATFRLGTEFVDWNAIGQRWMHPCGEVGARLDTVAFHHHWLRVAKEEGAEFESFSLPAEAAKLGRFAHPAADPRSVLSTLSYAFHFDTALYARYLRRYAETRGVTRTEGAVSGVSLQGAAGLIESVVLENGERIEGDLFIDCSGFRSVLIEEALHIGYEDWTHWLPCDRAVAVASVSASVTELKPCTRTTARGSGWEWHIPLQDRIGSGYVYSSRYLSDDEAAATLASSPAGHASADPRLVKFTAGHRKKFWTGNCVAIGPAAGFLEPLASTTIHLIQSAVAKLLALFPDRSFASATIDEYNRLATVEYERIRDFLILHYCLSARDDTPFWRHVREMSLPPTLERKIGLFASRGRVVLYDDETFGESSWVSVFVGHGRWPKRVDPRAALVDANLTRERLRRMRVAIQQAAQAMPTHRVFMSERGLITSAAPPGGGRA
jgi:tryptophan 7-halogenase